VADKNLYVAASSRETVLKTGKPLGKVMCRTGSAANGGLTNIWLSRVRSPILSIGNSDTSGHAQNLERENVSRHRHNHVHSFL